MFYLQSISLDKYVSKPTACSNKWYKSAYKYQHFKLFLSITFIILLFFFQVLTSHEICTPLTNCLTMSWNQPLCYFTPRTALL